MCEVFFLGTARRTDSQISDRRDGSTVAIVYRDAWYFEAREDSIGALVFAYMPGDRVKTVEERNPTEGPASLSVAILVSP